MKSGVSMHPVSFIRSFLAFSIGGLACLSAKENPVTTYRGDGIRILYETAGENAVSATDADRNGVPDQVEDAATQTLAARKLFVEVLGFPDPLRSDRYRGVEAIEIRFRSKKSLVTNGAAFDEPGPAAEKGGRAVLRFDLATSVMPSENLTPSHELFHLIQNGATYFKNRWFTEGTARWSERALGNGGLGPVKKLQAWPLSEKDQTVLFRRNYDASEWFWNPLAEKMDQDGGLPDSPALQQLREMKYVDGSLVLKDLKLTGWAFVRDVLLELGKTDDLAFKELGYREWSEANQKKDANNSYLLRAVAEVVARRSSAEK